MVRTPAPTVPYGGMGTALLRALSEEGRATFTTGHARRAARGLGVAAAYLPDFSDVSDVTCHLQLLADPAFAARVLARLRRAEPAVRGATGGARPFAGGTSPDPEPSPVAEAVVRDLDAALGARGLVPITVDLTTPDIAACGMAEWTCRRELARELGCELNCRGVDAGLLYQRVRKLLRPPPGLQGCE